MRKSTKIVKRVLALFLVVLMSIESFAAVVSDNDGSAFITKAEYDILKNNFQAQIDQYNTSIDSKIDGAIASYLAGIKLDSGSDLELINTNVLYPLSFYETYPNTTQDKINEIGHWNKILNLSWHVNGIANSGTVNLWLVAEDYYTGNDINQLFATELQGKIDWVYNGVVKTIEDSEDFFL